MRLGLDLDGVIIDHTDNKIAIAKKFGFSLSREQTAADAMKSIIPTPVRREIQKLLYDNKEWSLGAPLVPGAIEALREIKENKVPFFLISRRKVPAKAIELLEIHNLWPTFFNQQNTFFVIEPEEKEVRTKEIGISHYVDDETDILDIIKTPSKKFLFDYLGIQKNSAYPIIRSWQELLEKLREDF
jgi:hypothetical protein